MKYTFLFILVLLTLLGGIVLTQSSCKKKKAGHCYCHYFGGNKIYHDFRGMSKQEQRDSCNELDRLAEPLAGDCEMQ